MYDSVNSPRYTLLLDEAAAKRIAHILDDQERIDMRDWLIAYEIPEKEIDITDTKKLIDLWVKNYDPKLSPGDDLREAELLRQAR